MTDAPQIDLGRELGQGTTGVVRHGILRAPFGPHRAGTEVAVKDLRPDAGAAEAEALEREGVALAAVAGRAHLSHLVHAGPPLVTLFLPGQSLREVLDEGPLAEPRVRRLGEDLARALAGLHDAGWWHGDVKPENARLDGEGALVLLDLGFARRLESEPSGAAGSLPYLSPEQCAGRPGAAAADVFSLGIVLAELATGRVPCAPDEDQRGDAEAWLQTRQEASSFIASSIDPRLSPLFDLLVHELLARSPADRPTAAAVAERLCEGERGTWWRDVLEQGSFGRSDPRAWLETGRLPFAGRAEELASLTSAYESAADGAGRAAWLEGEEGAGKSRLIAEFVAAARHSGAPPTYLDGRCSEFPDERPGQPLRALLRRWLRLPRRRPVGPRERALLEQVVPESILEVCTSALDPGAAEAPPGEGEAQAEALARLGREQPVVIFLDDVTFADPVTIDGLTRLADRLRETQVLLALGLRWGRPALHPVLLENLRARLATRVPVSYMLLGPVSEADVLELVQNLFHHSTPQLRLARVLYERSEGSPGMLTELLRTLEERGCTRRVRGGGGSLELLVGTDEIPEPGGLGRLFDERYEGQDPRARRWLRLLAALGGNLEARFLTQAFPDLDGEGALALLEEFQASGWLVAEEGRFQFARSGQRERLYALLEEHERAEAHAAAARVLSTWEGRDREYQRAYHLHAAGDHQTLLDLAAPLVRRLQTQGHPGRISTLTGWALDALDALDTEREQEVLRMELLEAAADAADRLGRRAAQRRALDSLTDLELDADLEPEAVGRTYLLHGRYSANTGQYGAARGMLRNAALLFRQAGTPTREADALLRMAHIQGHIGQLEEAQRLAKRALGLADDDVLRARCQLALAVVALLNDEFEETLRRVDRASSRLRRLDDPTGGQGALAAASLLRARTYRLAGRQRRAYGAIQRAARLAAQAGERRLQAETMARHGRLLLDMDRSTDAELVLREAVTTCQEIEYQRGQVLATVFLGTLLAENGDPDAPHLLSRNTELARQLGLGRVEALNLALLARLQRQTAGHEPALELARAGYRCFEQFGGELADRIVVTGTLALLLEEAGEGSSARDLARGLRQRVRRVNEDIQGTVLRQRHHRAAGSLLRAALSPEGPVYPRATLQGPAGS